MAETLSITGLLHDAVHEVRCDDVGMSGSVPLMGWMTRIIGPVYDYGLALNVVNQLRFLFGPQFLVQWYTDVLSVTPPPVLDRLMPASIEQSGSDVTLHVYGHSFTPRSQIVFNGSPEATTFVSTTELTTTVVGATATTPGRYPVQVQTAAPGGGVTSSRWFYVLAPDDVTVKRCTLDHATCWEVPI